jgi:hypothetical protein
MYEEETCLFNSILSTVFCFFPLLFIVFLPFDHDLVQKGECFNSHIVLSSPDNCWYSIQSVVFLRAASGGEQTAVFEREELDWGANRLDGGGAPDMEPARLPPPWPSSWLGPDSVGRHFEVTMAWNGSDGATEGGGAAAGIIHAAAVGGTLDDGWWWWCCCWCCWWW